MTRILAVDDDPLMESYYRDVFADAGYEVRTAPDATAAMLVYYDFNPDLLVLDADMPGGGGERVFTISRTLLEADIPVIFVTAIPKLVLNLALTKTEVRIFIKPVKLEELLAAVKMLLKRTAP